jgi:hypothetical protein
VRRPMQRPRNGFGDAVGSGPRAVKIEQAHPTSATPAAAASHGDGGQADVPTDGPTSSGSSPFGQSGPAMGGIPSILRMAAAISYTRSSSGGNPGVEPLGCAPRAGRCPTTAGSASRRSTKTGFPLATALSSSLGTKMEAVRAEAEWMRTIAGAASIAVMICWP